MQYTAVIRTLGKGGKKYQQLLNSLVNQTIKPTAIIVYIAEGYVIPKETIGIEQYVYVKKGMLAQRALSYKEIKTEYILCLDDDLQFPPNTIERMFQLLQENHADVISPDIFANNQRALSSELMMTLSGRMRARRNNDNWGYKIMRTGGYSYNKHLRKEIYISQTNAGACFLCKKKDFLKLNLSEELWVDQMTYPIGEDQVMYYKMFCNGLKQLTWYNHQIEHLDAGNNLTPEKEKNRLYGDVYSKTIFWHRFIYTPEKNRLVKLWDIACITYYLTFTLFISLTKCNCKVLKAKWTALIDAYSFLRSEKYKSLSRITKVKGY